MKPMHCAAALLLAVPAGALAEPVEEPAICTDRPTKANAVCTVPSGKWQLESSAISWSVTKTDGVETRLLSVGSSVMKLGLSDRSDLQVGITPYVRTTIDIAGMEARASGVGDLTVRYKHRVTADDAAVQVGLVPFVKLPTADGDIGNGKVEGGLAVPVSIATGSPVSLVIGPELDMLVDVDGNGHHPALVNLVNLSVPVASRMTIYGELWTMANFDPADHVMLASADAALTYAISPAAQLDLGANFGLTRHTPDAELYLGISFRF